jgi:hypothetical protein
MTNFFRHMGEQAAYFDGGELYFIGEADPSGGGLSPFVKVGIVRDRDGRSSADRLAEHQTGNPRRLILLDVDRSPIVEVLETSLHARFAPIRVGGEWLHVPGDRYEQVRHVSMGMAADARSAESDFRAAEELKKVPSDAPALTPSSAVKELHRRWALADAAEKTLTEALEQLRKMFARAHEAGNQLEAFFTATVRKGGSSFNEKAFRDDHPELAQQYTTSVSRFAQRFTPAAIKKAERLAALTVFPDVVDILRQVESAKSVALEHTDFARLHDLYLEVLGIHAPHEWDTKLAEVQIRAACGTASGIDSVCTWNRAEKSSEKLDTAALKRDRPDLHEKYREVRPDVVANEVSRHRNYAVPALP